MATPATRQRGGWRNPAFTPAPAGGATPGHDLRGPAAEIRCLWPERYAVERCVVRGVQPPEVRGSRWWPLLQRLRPSAAGAPVTGAGPVSGAPPKLWRFLRRRGRPRILANFLGSASAFACWLAAFHCSQAFLPCSAGMQRWKVRHFSSRLVMQRGCFRSQIRPGSERPLPPVRFDGLTASLRLSSLPVCPLASTAETNHAQHLSPPLLDVVSTSPAWLFVPSLALIRMLC